MDIGAYMRIEELESIAKANNISVPRLRGYRMMASEELFTEEDLEKVVGAMTVCAVENLIEGWSPFGWFPCFECHSWSSRQKVKKKYLTIEKTENGGERYSGVRWDRLHGKKRKAAKYTTKKYTEAVINQFNTWNKYVGRSDILYVHARIGGNNWAMYKNDVIHHPGFLEKVDDSHDNTYCDLYFKLDITEV